MKELLPLWEPSAAFKEQSHLTDYLRWLQQNKGLVFDQYHDLWKWSIDDIEGFWGSFAAYAHILFHHPWEYVVQKQTGMIGTKWFAGGLLNYAEHIFRNKNDQFPAILFSNERGIDVELSWKELEGRVGKLADWMKSRGIKKGDRVTSLMPNIPETVIAFLAAQSIGAVWSSCSPEFGKDAVVDRFEQIEPVLLFVTNGYQYNGKTVDRLVEWEEIMSMLPTVKDIVLVRYPGEQKMHRCILWEEIMDRPETPLLFEPLPFDHPLWILYSSGTTGKPKPIVHSVGGNLIEHLKVLLLHWDVKKGERFFWYSTTGWMMWNFSVASLLTGAVLMLYDGSPTYPDIQHLWTWVQKQKINHFGGGASFFTASMKNAGNNLKGEYRFLRTIGSTGSPLPAECFNWIYKEIKSDVWLISFSGGTDICSGFVGGCPILPVYPGEIQCRLLGVALEARDENGLPCIGKPGEMVITEPMPSMPLYFWNDRDNERYKDAYFSMFPGCWRHGDWVEITDRGTVIIYGRSDAVLNRDGVRIGTAEIYAVVEKIPEVDDSIVVGLEQETGGYFMPLFVKLKPGAVLSEGLKQKIKHLLKTNYSPRHVPDEILEIHEIPYTSNGKKKEAEMKKWVKKGSVLNKTDPDKPVDTKN